MLARSKAELLAKAKQAASAAYCPYSHFRVGAAVLADGEIFSGCNVENASYSLTICAERVAVFKAIAAGHKTIEAIAVVCPDAEPNGHPTKRMPCGACRQVIAEFASEPTAIIVDGVGEFALSELLPLPFKL